MMSASGLPVPADLPPRARGGFLPGWMGMLTLPEDATGAVELVDSKLAMVRVLHADGDERARRIFLSVHKRTLPNRRSQGNSATPCPLAGRPTVEPARCDPSSRPAPPSSVPPGPPNGGRR